MKKGWEVKRLGEVCTFDKMQGLHRGLPYVGLEHIESHTAQFIGSNEPQLVKSSTFRFTEKHVLYGRLRPYLNKALVPDFEGHCSTEIFPLKPRPELSREYLLFWLLCDETCDRINATCTGARMPRAQMNDVLDFQLPIPPLSEQHRIVGLLDEAFEGIAIAKANAEKNLQNAQAIFESHLQAVFSQRGEGWVETRLGDVCTVKDGTHDSPKYVADGIPFVTQKNIREDGLSFEKTQYISQEDHNDFYRRSNASYGDILISMIGANRGMACIVDDKRMFSIKNVGLVKQDQSINHVFLLYYLKSPQAASFVKSASKGGAQEFVGLTELRWFPVPLPSLECQNRLAKIFQSLHQETQRLTAIYQQKLAALKALKKSLLHQAFAGDL